MRLKHVDEFFGEFDNFSPLRARARDWPAIFTALNLIFHVAGNLFWFTWRTLKA
jgi:hypothetical protein